MEIESLCQCCGQSFLSRSALNKHLKAKCVLVQYLVNVTSLSQLSSPIPVFQSKAIFETSGSGFVFCGWSYATAAVTLVPSAIPDHTSPAKSCFLDTGCGVTLVDRSWVAQQLPNQKISKIAIPLKVRGIDSAKHNSNEFVSVSLYFLGRDKSKQLVYARINRKLHFVDSLRANILIENDIIGSEQISIDIAERTALVASCRVCIPISAGQRSKPLMKKVLNAEAMTLPPCTKTFVPVLFPDLSDD